MATSTGQDGKAVCSSNVDLLLHPELLSQDFMQLILSEKNVSTRDCGSRDRLTDLYLRHVIPLPQRTLPNSRWGRRVEKSRGSSVNSSSSNDHNRKRPLIVFDGSSSHSGPLKVRKPEGSSTVSTGITDRLKPPPAGNLSNPIRKLSGNTSSSSIHRSTDPANLKREANSSVGTFSVTSVMRCTQIYCGIQGKCVTPKSPEVKKKIQHVTWP
uniref:Ashwin n=1 Tax=Seriola dumerili TaxID=41447 RepID=A0A3B4TR44_SERDU